jgi:membrane complex biogenesis BtpA family protein
MWRAVWVRIRLYRRTPWLSTEIVTISPSLGEAYRVLPGLGGARVQILAGANREAMAVARAAGLDFFRAEGFAFAHVADEGIIQSSAAELLRYRRAIGAERVQVWADVKKKHSSHAITADVDIGQTAHAVEFMRGDAVIVTGTVTGAAPQRSDVLAVNRQTRLPVSLGSGVTAKNLKNFFGAADGFIVGSEFKQDGHWSRAVDARRVAQFMTAHRKLAG